MTEQENRAEFTRRTGKVATMATTEYTAYLAGQASTDKEMLRLIESIKYLRGIAERGTGNECPPDVTIEKFVLGYVQEIERELEQYRSYYETDIKDLLKAQAGEQEPVAWMHPTVPLCVSSNEYTYKDAIPLFTHPTTERRVPEDVRNVMEMALSALEHAEKDVADYQRINTDQSGEAITALRNALNAAPTPTKESE